MRVKAGNLSASPPVSTHAFFSVKMHPVVAQLERCIIIKTSCKEHP